MRVESVTLFPALGLNQLIVKGAHYMITNYDCKQKPETNRVSVSDFTFYYLLGLLK